MLHENISHDSRENFTQGQDATVNIERAQGADSNSGKMQHSLLKQSLPAVHCSFEGLAARHINSINGQYLVTVNTDHGVDVYRRNGGKVKSLEIEYMRCSLVV
jgi:hypothetical protein